MREEAGGVREEAGWSEGGGVASFTYAGGQQPNNPHVTRERCLVQRNTLHLHNTP